MNEKKSDPEIIPPRVTPTNEVESGGGDFYAQFNQFSDRPDLLIDAIEKHDPGFVKRMNERSLGYSDKVRDARYTFGRIEAYMSIFVRGVVAIFIGWAVMRSIIAGNAGFGTLLGAALFFALVMSGRQSFNAIASAIRDVVARQKTTD